MTIDEREKDNHFPEKITAKIWFYVVGWLLGIATIFIAEIMTLFIFAFNTACETIYNLDIIVMGKMD